MAPTASAAAFRRTSGGEEADAVIAAVRLESPMPVVREGVRVRLNPAINELEAVGAGGRVKSVGWPSR